MDSSKSPHSSLELWKWTLTPASSAPCFISDVLTIPANESKEDFYWLGSVPCRSVLVVAMVVGIQVLEKKIIYTLDDGSAVIEVMHTPGHVSSAASTSRRSTELHAQHTAPATSNRHHLPTPPSELRPVAAIGDSVRTVGRIITWFDSRRLKVDNIERCLSGNDDSLHIMKVIRLRKERYNLPGPFVIPQTETAAHDSTHVDSAVSQFQPRLAVSSSTAISAVFSKESTRPGVASEFVCQVAVPTSPSKRVPSSLDPQTSSKLRHPLRLHPRDLTANTFRIYIKYYMDRVSEHASREKSEFTAHPDEITSPHQLQRACTVRFTLSFLRCVPELSTLAKRVVAQDKKTQEAQDKQKGRATRTGADGARNKGKERAVPGHAESAEDRVKRRYKMKMLFRWAVVELYKEGSIVLCNPDAEDYVDPPAPDPSMRIWKESVNSEAAEGSRMDVETVDGVSDAPPDEEGYVSLTPAYLGGYVEQVVRALTLMPMSASRTQRTTLEKGKPLQKRSVTVEEITRYLRRSDGRWERVGEWIVQDALMWLWQRAMLEEDGNKWRCGRAAR